jgi:hypothetical protein
MQTHCSRVVFSDTDSDSEAFSVFGAYALQLSLCHVPVIACACYACMTTVHYIIIVNDVKQEYTFGG